MDSPLVRVILALLGGYIAILLGWTVYDWIKKEYPQSTVNPPCSNPVQHPYYHDRANEVLDRFAGLSNAEKESLKQSLAATMITLQQWLVRFEQSDCEIICLGEQHEELTRTFLAQTFFPNVTIDVLLLEASPEELTRLIDKRNVGRAYYPLLDADILNILRSATESNPQIGIYGIEETDAQQNAYQGESGRRDQALAQNFWKQFSPGKRHAILFGALHCANRADWLYDRINRQATPALKSKVLNVCVVEEHQSGPLEAFVYFLDQIGVETKDFVLSDTKALDHRIYMWFPYLSQRFLEQYRTLMVFRACQS